MLQRDARRSRHAPPPVAAQARRFRAVVAYDGTAYAGFQRQRERVTVQEILEAAIEEATRLPAIVGPAGRTDSGVHADGQVVAFNSTTALPASAIQHLFRHLLPDDVRVLRVEEAPADFHPQLHAIRKLYRSTMSTAAVEMPRLRRVHWNVGGPLDLPAMRAAAVHLVGTHDFRTFRSDPGPRRRGEGTVRTIESIDLRAESEIVTLDIVGPGFLYMMVRNVTSALVEVGRAARPPGWIAEVLARRDRSLVPPPSPAHGLTLVRVEYADGFGA